MNRDELAFFNDQLATMLRQGIPLEGAFRQLAGGMRQGHLRDELLRLEAELTQGKPLREAVAARKLPELYCRLLVAGAEGGDLPGLLTLAADHYHQAANLSARLKGVAVYPILALITSVVVSVLLAIVLGAVEGGGEQLDIFATLNGEWNASLWIAGLWWPPVLFAGITAMVLILLALPGVRHYLRWHLPGFRDASLANLAGSLALLLKSGCPLPEAIRLCAGLEASPAAARELGKWEERLARGERPLDAVETRKGIFPSLFLWLVSSDPEDLQSGFARAAAIYRRRARARAEMLLYAAMPVLVLFLGGLVLGQATFAVRMIYTTLIRQLDAMGG